MRKISSYLYPNRIELLANVAGFTTEYTNVYQRTVKIYKGVDNVIEFDIKNADQKRIDLSENPVLTDLYLNVMDAQGNALPNSPYTITPFSINNVTATGAVVSGTGVKSTTTTIVIPNANITGEFKIGYGVVNTNIVGAVSISAVDSDIDSSLTTLTVTFKEQTVTAHTVSISASSNPLKGIATTTIPSTDLTDIGHQFLRYSVTATKNGDTIPLYADSRFGVVGTIEVVGSAMPTTRGSTVFDRFSGEINFDGDVINHTSVIPAKFYEAVPTATLDFSIEMTDYIGDVYLEATKDSTISVESFRTELGNAAVVATRTYTTANSTTLTFDNISTEGWNYFRVSWRYLDKVLIGVNSVYPTGTVDKVTVS